MTVLETVYAVHNFEAENDDELTFQIGEPVIVIQKDDGFNDGWWKGKNVRGEVGLFPMNYITFELYQHKPLLPTPSTSDTTNKSSHSISIDTSLNEKPPSVRSSFSFTCPATLITGPSSTISNMSGTSSSNHNINVLRRLVINTLFLPTLRSTSPEEWDMDQVELWLTSMNFGCIATNFKSQEITGDILLELSMNSLKELDISTYGKRFKVHTALNVLREECGYQTTNPMNRMSVTSSTYSDDLRLQRLQSPTSPTASRHSHRQSSSYHSNLIMEKHHRRKSERADTIKEYDEQESIGLQSPESPASASQLIFPESNYDIMEANSKNYENDHSIEKIPDNTKDISMIQKRQTVLPMAHRSSMDIYSTRTTDDSGNVTPDMEGWLYKQGCKYKKWNKRWFVLKGPNLFYFKSPKDVRMKGIINLRGYRIIPDESIQPGKYSFKAQHEEERTFYFYTDVDTNVKAWISSLMKATISRDFTAPVLSSSMIPTVSLDVARRMRPRPPSVLLYRKENLKNNASLSPQSYEASYGGYYSPISENSSASSKNHKVAKEEEELTNQDSGFDSDQPNRDIIHPEEDEGEFEDEGHYEEIQFASWTNADLIEWVNSISDSIQINMLSDLRQGDILIEILQELSGKKIKQLPPSTAGSTLMLDNVVAAFKFMNMEGIEIDDQFTIKDIFGGKQDKIKLMLHSILEWSLHLHEQ